MMSLVDVMVFDIQDIGVRSYTYIYTMAKAMEACAPFIMEPIQDVEVIIPDEYMGDIMSDLNGKRGRI